MRRPVARRAELPATGDHASSAPTTPAPTTPAADRRARRARARAAVARSHRSYAARPVNRGERSYRHAVAAQLDVLGRADKARALRQCGETAMVWECSPCGDPHASVAVLVGCGLRVCPYCATAAGAAARARGLRALATLPGVMRRGHSEALDAARAETHKRAEAVAYWQSKAQGSKAVDYFTRQLTAATERYRAARRVEAEVASVHRWRWRLITVSPKWTPADPTEVEVEGLRRRSAEAWEVWGRVWGVVGAGGHAAAIAHIECSASGHIHVHALVFGPWRDVEDMAEAAGCIVDVQKRYDGHAADDDGAEADDDDGGAEADDDDGGAEADDDDGEGAIGRALRGAATEALKYALKGPGLRSEWVAGAPYEVASPRLAAAWQVACEHAQLVRRWGPMRDADREASTAAPSSDARADAADQLDADAAPVLGRCCASCGASLAGVVPRVERTADVARALGPRWTRAPSRHPVWGTPLPARVALVRRV